jgi:hypothetical protein
VERTSSESISAGQEEESISIPLKELGEDAAPILVRFQNLTIQPGDNTTAPDFKWEVSVRKVPQDITGLTDNGIQIDNTKVFSPRVSVKLNDELVQAIASGGQSNVTLYIEIPLVVPKAPEEGTTVSRRLLQTTVTAPDSVQSGSLCDSTTRYSAFYYDPVRATWSTYQFLQNNFVCSQGLVACSIPALLATVNGSAIILFSVASPTPADEGGKVLWWVSGSFVLLVGLVVAAWCIFRTNWEKSRPVMKGKTPNNNEVKWQSSQATIHPAQWDTQSFMNRQGGHNPPRGTRWEGGA